MNKIRFSLALGLILLAACQPQSEPADVVLSAAKGWDAGAIDAAKMDASLAYFADDAVVKLVGLPGGTDTISGKEAIRAWWEVLADQHFNMTVDVLSVHGDTVTTKMLSWNDWSRQAGIAPLEATEAYVVRGGKIVSETWTITEKSQQEVATALAIALAPPATLAPEMPISSLEDVVGAWQISVGGDLIAWQILPDGSFIVDENISRGTLAVEGSQVHFLTDSYCLTAQEARYEVYVIKQAEEPVGLRFVLVGEDGCVDRKDALAGETLQPAHP